MIILILLVCILLASLLYLSIRFPKPNTKPAKPLDAILILGCPANEDGSISSMLKKRCDRALQLSEQYHCNTFILSGSNVKNQYKEADVMAQYCHTQNPKLHLIKEEQAKNTYENFKYAKELPYSSILTITSPSHMRRAAFFMKKFYRDVCVDAYKKKDPLPVYCFEYTRMWICLYYEWKLSKQ